MGKKKGQKKGANPNDEWYQTCLLIQFLTIVGIVYRKDDGTVPSLLDQAEMTGEDLKQPDVGKQTKSKKNMTVENRLALCVLIYSRIKNC